MKNAILIRVIPEKFEQWFAEAKEKEPNDPNAMVTETGHHERRRDQPPDHVIHVAQDVTRRASRTG